jgi:hypothetical protein
VLYLKLLAKNLHISKHHPDLGPQVLVLCIKSWTKLVKTLSSDKIQLNLLGFELSKPKEKATRHFIDAAYGFWLELISACQSQQHFLQTWVAFRDLYFVRSIS